MEPNLALRGTPRTFRAPKRAFQGQNEPFWGPQEYRRGSISARAHDMDVTHPVGPTSDSWDLIRALVAFRGPPGPSEDL